MMKLHLSLFVAAASWHYESCLGSDLAQSQPQMGDAATLAAPTAVPPPHWMGQAPGEFPAAPVAGVPYPAPPGTWGYQQTAFTPGRGDYPPYPAPPAQYPVPIGFHPVPVIATQDAASHRTAENENNTTEESVSPASRERSARKSMLRAVLWVFFLNICLHISQALEGTPDRTNMLLMFLFTIPHLLYLGSVVNLLVKVITWFKRLFSRVTADDGESSGKVRKREKKERNKKLSKSKGRRTD